LNNVIRITNVIMLCLGAVDGTHIRIDKLTQDYDSYINRK